MVERKLIVFRHVRIIQWKSWAGLLSEVNARTVCSLGKII